MEGQRLYFRVFFKRRACPCRYVGVSGAVDHHLWFDAYKAIFICESHRLDTISVALDCARKRIVQDGEVLLLFNFAFVQERANREEV